MKLYNIPAEIDEFEKRLIDNEGELTPEMEKEWADFIAGSKERMEAASFVLKRLKKDAETCREEVQRLSGRARSMESNRERLSGLTLYALKALGGRLKTALVSMWTGRTGEQIVIEQKADADLGKLHETHPELVRVSYALNFEAAKQAVKDGAELPECLIVRHQAPTEFLVIK